MDVHHYEGVMGRHMHNSNTENKFTSRGLSHSVAIYFFMRQRSRTVPLPKFAICHTISQLIFLAGVTHDNVSAERTLRQLCNSFVCHCITASLHLVESLPARITAIGALLVTNSPVLRLLSWRWSSNARHSQPRAKRISSHAGLLRST